MMRRDETATMELLRRHNAIMDAAAKRHGGDVINRMGDFYLVCIDSAVDAVECAVDAQGLFADFNEQRPRDKRIAVRIGVHLGDILVEGKDIFGDGVNVASRIQGVVPPGRIGITAEVYAVVRGKVSRGFVSIGTRELKGIPDPVEVFQDEGGEPAAANPPAREEGPVRLTASMEPEFQKPLPEISAGPAPLDPDVDLSVAAEMEERSRRENAAKEAKGHAPLKGPITDAVLSVGHTDLLFKIVGGITVLERHLFNIKRAGIERLWIAARKPSKRQLRGLRAPKELEIYWTAGDDSMRERFKAPYLSISSDHLIRLETIRYALSQKHDRPTSYQDPEQYGALQVIPFQTDRLDDFFKERPMPEDSCLLLHSNPERGPGLDWLLRGLHKETDSFMARNFDRRLSLALTRLLVNTRVRPNHVTIFSTAVGLLGAAMMAGGRYEWILAGALTVLFHTWLDGVDGELARLRHQQSRLGGQLDFWGDNAVHFALFSCLGAGVARLTGERLYLGLGFIGAVASGLCAYFVYRYSLEKEVAGKPLFQGLEGLQGAQKPGGLRGLLISVEHTLSQRDFVYLLAFLAMIGQTWIFLWASAVGAPAFLLVFLTLRILAEKS